METAINIPRPIYLNRILPYVDKNLVKVVTGQRRVGKSYILKSVESVIRRENPQSNIICINLEDFAFSHITDAAALNGEIVSHLSATQKNYIFIDEIQEVDGFEKVIRSLIMNPNNDVYVTGSNSAMLSSEIASRLAGRSVEVRVHPLSYVEFLEFHSLEDSDESLGLFLRFGGMPYLRNLPLQSTWNEYLGGVADALIYRDVVARHSIRNNDFLQRLMLFLGRNAGQIFTAKSVADYIKSQRSSATVTSVQNYVDYICDAYLINKIRRWDIEGKRFFEMGEKSYFEDLGIRNVLVGYRPGDIGALMENAVCNELACRGYDVRIGVLPKGREIDFVAERDGERRYIQVSLRIDNSATAEREFGNLAVIADNYDKLVITLNDSAPNSYEGIKMKSLREFLTEG